jgi:hypothetical protein
MNEWMNQSSIMLCVRRTVILRSIILCSVVCCCVSCMPSKESSASFKIWLDYTLALRFYRLTIASTVKCDLPPANRFHSKTLPLMCPKRFCWIWRDQAVLWILRRFLLHWKHNMLHLFVLTVNSYLFRSTFNASWNVRIWRESSKKLCSTPPPLVVPIFSWHYPIVSLFL